MSQVKRLGTTQQNGAYLEASMSSGHHGNQARMGGTVIVKGKGPQQAFLLSSEHGSAEG